MEQNWIFIIPSLLPFFVTVFALCQVEPLSPYYSLCQLPFLAELAYLSSFLIPHPYDIVPFSVAILLAWLSAAVYWVNLEDKCQVIQQCKEKVIILIAGSFFLTIFFSDDQSPVPWAEETARIISIVFAFLFLAFTFLPQSYPQLLFIFGAIIAAHPMQMTLQLVTSQLENYFGDTRADPILRFFWFLAAGFEGILPMYAVTYLANGDIVWPKFKLSTSLDDPPPQYTAIAVSTDDERRALLG